MSASPCGRYVAGSTTDGHLVVWSISSRSCIATYSCFVFMIFLHVGCRYYYYFMSAIIIMSLSKVTVLSSVDCTCTRPLSTSLVIRRDPTTWFIVCFITYFLLLSIPSFSTRIVPLRFQARGRRRRPNLDLVCFVV